MSYSIRTVDRMSVPRLDRNGNPFESSRTVLGIFTTKESVQGRGKALAAALAMLKLPTREVEPRHTEVAYNAKGDACGFLVVAHVA